MQPTRQKWHLTSWLHRKVFDESLGGDETYVFQAAHENIRLKLYVLILERFSNECRKTKTKVIIPANHNKHKLPNEPIRTRSKYM